MTDFQPRKSLASAEIAATATTAIFGTRYVEAPAPSFMNNVPNRLLADKELRTLKFALEKSKAEVIRRNTAREATVEEFPISNGIAEVSMGLKPGAMRELRRHACIRPQGEASLGVAPLQDKEIEPRQPVVAIAPRHHCTSEGDIALAQSGWRTHALSNRANLRKLHPATAPVTSARGMLGSSRMVAYA